LASVLLEMPSVREILGDEAALARLDTAVERALLRVPKSFGKSAGFDGHLGRALTGEALDTAELIRVATAGIADFAEAHTALAEQAHAIAALLDAPRVSELLKATTSMAPEDVAARKGCPHLYLGLGEAARRKHRKLTTRHVIVAAVRSFEKILIKRGLPWNGDTAHLDLLLEREPLRSDGAIEFAPRLVGALAGAVARPEPSLDFAFLGKCFARDAAAASARGS